MSEERMVMRRMYEVDVININLTPEQLEDWRRHAAQSIAEEILANGCLVHQSEYDIRGGYVRENFSVLVAQRERTLP